jgi:hypothetical protein
LAVADCIAMQIFDMEVVHRLVCVSDGQLYDGGMLSGSKQQKVSDPQVDRINPPPFTEKIHRIHGDMFRLWALAQCLATDHPPRVVTCRFDLFAANANGYHIAVVHMLECFDNTAQFPVVRD